MIDHFTNHEMPPHEPRISHTPEHEDSHIHADECQHHLVGGLRPVRVRPGRALEKDGRRELPPRRLVLPSLLQREEIEGAGAAGGGQPPGSSGPRGRRDGRRAPREEGGSGVPGEAIP